MSLTEKLAHRKLRTETLIKTGEDIGPYTSKKKKLKVKKKK